MVAPESRHVAITLSLFAADLGRLQHEANRASLVPHQAPEHPEAVVVLRGGA